jgi:hypothetical protein
MQEFSILLSVLAAWIVLNRWVLPRFGIQTCMSGGCHTDRCPSCAPESLKQHDKDG